MVYNIFVRIAILDFISPFTEKVCESIVRCGADYDLFPHDADPEILKGYDGIILTGSYDCSWDGGRRPDIGIYDLGKPILGICYGHQITSLLLGGQTAKSKTPEKEVVECFMKDSPLFEGLPEKQKVLMYHYDEVIQMADDFECIAETDRCAIAGCQNEERKIYTVQFHPEGEGNDCGDEIFMNFIKIAGRCL